MVGPFPTVIEGTGAVRAYYFRAYDEAGHKRSGTLEAHDRQAAAFELRKSGLRPYFVHDYQAFLKSLRDRQKQRKRIIVWGSVAIVIALIYSGWLITHSGQERGPKVSEYAEAGFLKGAVAAKVGNTPEEREFASEMMKVWQQLAADAVRGIEINKVLMTVSVKKSIHQLSDSEIELLATTTAKSFQRRFGMGACEVWVVENDETILEVSYNAGTKAIRVKTYR